MKKSLLILAFCFPLASWAENEPAKFSLQDCYRAIWADVRSKPVADRLGIGQDPIPLALRSSKAKANAKEKDSLEFVAAAMQGCQKLDQPNRAGHHALIKQWIEGSETGYKDVLTRLYAGDLSWGAAIAANEENTAAFEKRRLELIAIGEARLEQEKQQAAAAKAAAEAEYQRRAALRAEMERQQQADARRRQAEQERQAQQDIINSLQLMQRPRPAISCRSTQFFDTVTTNCN